MPLIDKAKRREYNRRYRERHPEQIRAWDAQWRQNNKPLIRELNLKRTGFTTSLFDDALELQAHRCPICRVDLRTLPPKRVHADHCHLTGQPRGVLCHHCNAGLGCFADDPERLQRALTYLTSFPLSIV